MTTPKAAPEVGHCAKHTFGELLSWKRPLVDNTAFQNLMEKCLLQLTVPGAAVRIKSFSQELTDGHCSTGSVYCSEHFRRGLASIACSKDATPWILQLTT
jgi:hypothetical protein